MFKYPEKIILAVAPVAHKGTSLPSETHNPLSPEEIAADVAGCAKAGAAMVHLHVRNLAGDQVQDLALFSTTIDLIRKESDIVIQGSTGGVSDLSLEDRCVSVKEPRTELASLNMGSVNFGQGVYVNTLPDIHFWLGEMKKYQVKPELELFDLSMLSSVENLLNEGFLVPPVNYNFSLGFKGALPAEPGILSILCSRLPRGSHWGIIHEGMQDMKLLAAALGMGASVIRVGFEDGRSYKSGKNAPSNTVLVQKAAELIRSLGFEIAIPSEAREILGVLKK
jgi:3-keto-5-aminohexanoate cleavage enzyme